MHTRKTRPMCSYDIPSNPGEKKSPPNHTELFFQGNANCTLCDPAGVQILLGTLERLQGQSTIQEARVFQEVKTIDIDGGGDFFSNDVEKVKPNFSFPFNVVYPTHIA